LEFGVRLELKKPKTQNPSFQAPSPEPRTPNLELRTPNPDPIGLLDNLAVWETPMESSPALSLGIAIATLLVGITSYAIYTAFGPPADQLADPFEDHED
jgi:PsbN protein